MGCRLPRVSSGVLRSLSPLWSFLFLTRYLATWYVLLDSVATSKNRCGRVRNVSVLASDTPCEGSRDTGGIGLGQVDCRFDTRATAGFGMDEEFPTDQVKPFAHADQSESGS